MAAAEAASLSSAAFSSALDASSGLTLTWVSHWQQLEAAQQARRALLGSVRGRQQQRQRQLATLLNGGSSGGGFSAADAAAATLAAAEAAVPGRGVPAASSSQHASRLDLLPPLQQMSEMDELTWLASHPPEESAAPGADGSSDSGSGMHLWSHHSGQGEASTRVTGGSSSSSAAGPDSGGGGGGGGDGTTGEGAVQQGPVQLWVGGELVGVRPLWIAVYQPEEEGPAK